MTKKFKWSGEPFEDRVPDWAGKIAYEQEYDGVRYSVGLGGHKGSYTNLEDAENMLIACIEMSGEEDIPCFYFDADGGVELLEIVEE